jgi:hypothetical protein
MLSQVLVLWFVLIYNLFFIDFFKSKILGKNFEEETDRSLMITFKYLQIQNFFIICI